jgi:hypothetical protein
MKVMIDQVPDPRDKAPTLKESSGWFAAGNSFRRALPLLSDGAFKMFAYICLEADPEQAGMQQTNGMAGALLISTHCQQYTGT